MPYTEEQILTKINKEVEKRKTVVFHGFIGEYTNTKTKLDLECLVCGNHWGTCWTSAFLRGTGCPKCGARTNNNFVAKAIPWVGETRTSPEGNIQTIQEVHGAYVYYSCSHCSQDKELFPNLFKIHKSGWRTEAQPCGCGSQTRWNKDQYYILCERKSEERNCRYKFIGFTGGWKGCDTKVVLSCCRHGLWGTQTIDKYLSTNPRGCPACAKEARNFGFYKNKKDDLDNLYLARFTDKGESFIKVGRTFDIKHRFSYFDKTDYEVELLATVQGIHKDIYDDEQNIHYLLDKYHHSPLKPFGGSVGECFRVSALDTYVIKQYFDLHR